MEKIESLKGKKVALIGLGASQIDYVIGMENSKQWDEVWVINSALSVFACDRVFMMDPVSRYLDTEDAGNQTDVMRRLLPTFDKPIYSCELDDRVPAVVEVSFSRSHDRRQVRLLQHNCCVCNGFCVLESGRSYRSIWLGF
jgi:cation diffusion facilitator CzcD-associated flavoprotein CzcO